MQDLYSIIIHCMHVAMSSCTMPITITTITDGHSIHSFNAYNGICMYCSSS